MSKAIKKLICFSAASLFSFPVFSLAPQEGKLPPRVFLWGNAGNRFLGETDAMLPLFGNPYHSFFVDITGKYGNDDAWLASGGIGNRTIVRNEAIVGAYVFGDYNRTPNSKYFTVVNPGLEWMTNVWDAHLNGYFPVGKKSKTLGLFTGGQAGLSNTQFFSGHSQYDTIFDYVENVGPGADLEIGKIFPSLNYTRVFGGGYYFSPKNSANIRGFIGGIEMPLKFHGMLVGVSDSYDNLNHNTIAVTLRIRFGGLERSPNIQDRMLDLIPRHLGSLRSGDGIPSRKNVVNTGRKALLQDNIWFFNPGGTLSSIQGYQSCTFEHPCFGLSQEQIYTVNVLSPAANFYLSSGTYNNPALGSGFTFYNGQNIFGRTPGFAQMATGINRPLLNDSVILEGNNNLYNLRVQGNSTLQIDTGGMIQPFQAGIFNSPTSVGEVNIFNSEVNVASTTDNAIALANNSFSSTLNLYNSNLSSIVSNASGVVSVGAANLHAGAFNIYNSTIVASNSDLVNNFALSFGAVNNENGTMIISNSNIATYLLHGGLTAGVLNNSSGNTGVGSILITGSTITSNADDASLVGGVFNQGNNMFNNSGFVNISQSSISVTSNNNGGGTASGILTSGNGTLTVNGAAITATGDSGSISGLVVGDPASTLNYGNTLIALFTSGTAIGTPTQNGGTLNDNGGNQCFENGVPVPC